MRYSMIRYEVSGEQIQWSVVRAGKIVSSGFSESMNLAREVAEGFVLGHFKAEKIATIVLMGIGDKQLSLLKTTR